MKDEEPITEQVLADLRKQCARHSAQAVELRHKITILDQHLKDSRCIIRAKVDWNVQCRRIKVALLMKAGVGRKKIATMLGISVTTVESTAEFLKMCFTKQEMDSLHFEPESTPDCLYERQRSCRKTWSPDFEPAEPA